METPIHNETIFYQDSNVTVTQARFITNSKTYAMRNISSVHIFEIVKSRTLQVIMIIISILLLFSNDLRIAGVFILAVAALILFLTKNEFSVRISTNSGEANSIVSKDKSYIESIVKALNEAIIYRG